MFKPLLALASPAGPRARLSVFIFHRVHRQIDPLFPDEVDAKGFTTVCHWIQRWFNVLPLDEAVVRLREGRLPARAAALSFDDGYADNHDVAMPLLRQLGLPCTFFVATGFLDGGRMWNDNVIESIRRTSLLALPLADLLPDLGELPCASIEEKRAAVGAVIARVKYREPAERLALVDEIARRSGAVRPTDLMMTSEQVRGLREGGMQVGAHTVSHPILARLPADEARREIGQSKRHLEALLGEPVRLFAYPNGKPGEDYVQQSVDIVREAGFDAAFSTAWGVAGSGSDPMQLPRFTPWERTPLRFGLRTLHNLRPRPPAAVQV
jgi:peptidoglycan/xylan/chitin deacetylase (PgdA/CDA1 family)